MNRFNERFYGRFQEAFSHTERLVSMNPDLESDFKDIHVFVHDIFPACFPSNSEREKKIWWFPLAEAGLDLEYSIFFAKAGIYKTAYMSLRNFMELSLVYFYYLLIAKSKGNEWAKGKIPTPFRNDILKVLFKNDDFRYFDSQIKIRESIDSEYGKLNDICHTRGVLHSHTTLSMGNYPRCIEESLRSFVTRIKAVIDVVMTCFVGVNPIILFPVPLDEKFGMSGPFSGYLKEYQVKTLHKLLTPESLKTLLAYYEANPNVASIRQYFEDLPDMTDEQRSQQKAVFDKNYGKA